MPVSSTALKVKQKAQTAAHVVAKDMEGLVALRVDGLSPFDACASLYRLPNNWSAR